MGGHMGCTRGVGARDRGQGRRDAGLQPWDARAPAGTAAASHPVPVDLPTCTRLVGGPGRRRRPRGAAAGAGFARSFRLFLHNQRRDNLPVLPPLVTNHLPFSLLASPFCQIKVRSLPKHLSYPVTSPSWCPVF